MLRFFGNDDIRALDLGHGEIVAALEAAYTERARGGVSLITKMGFQEKSGAFCHAMPVKALGLAVVKWVVSGTPDPGAKYINATLIASDAASGATLAVMEAEWLTALRTAGVTVAALKRLPKIARPVALFVGCGLQARIHAAMLRPFGIATVYAVSRRRETAERFASEMRETGLDAAACDSCDDILGRADIVVSAVPLDAGIATFLDAGRLKPGAFAASIDLGKPWFNVAAFQRAITDDSRHAEGLKGSGHLAFEGSFDADLADLVCGTAPAMAAADRIYMVAPGNALSDAAMVRLILDKQTGGSLQ
jgi:ornithine cyclodeaminase/alanine dehydrogenase